MVIKCSYFLTAWLLMNTLSPELLKKIYLILLPGTLTFQRRRFDLKCHVPLHAIHFYPLVKVDNDVIWISSNWHKSGT